MQSTRGEALGRFDTLIAAVSGSTLVAFVGLVVYAVLAAFGVLSSGEVSGAGAAGYGTGAVNAVGDAVDATSPVPVTYERRDATVAGEPASYLDFGTHTPLTEDGAVAIAPIWVFIDGFDETGAPRMIPDHPTVLDTIVGSADYSDLWDVQFVLVPEGFDSRAIRSLEDLDASDLETIPAGMLVNCPLVPESATTSEGHPIRSGWYRGELVHYFDLGMSSAEPGAVYEFVLAGDSTPEPLSVPPLVVLPENEGPPAQFFRRYEVEVSDEPAARAIRSSADLETVGAWVRATGELANRPLLAD